MLNLDNNLHAANYRLCACGILRTQMRPSRLDNDLGIRPVPHLTLATVLHHMGRGIHGCVAPKLSQRALARRAVDKGITSRNAKFTAILNTSNV
ncbi:MAG: hypothetical protein AAFR77_05675 [Cyanobacteria bacterium J06631_2]